MNNEWAAYIIRTLYAQLVVKASAELQASIVMDYFLYSLKGEQENENEQGLE